MLELSLNRAAHRAHPRGVGVAYGRALARVVADGRYPTLARVVRAGTVDGPGTMDDDFEAGLTCVLDGVAALLDSWDGDG